MGRGPGFVGLGWRWHREASGMQWHRALDRASACGAEVRGQGRPGAPPRGEDVCEECAQATGFKRRKKARAKVRIRLDLPRAQVRRVRAAGHDPEELLRRGWANQLAALQPVAEPAVAPADRDTQLRVHEVATGLLAEWGGGGVPGRALAKALRMRRSRLTEILGASRPIRFPDGVHRGYSAERIASLADGGG